MNIYNSENWAYCQQRVKYNLEYGIGFIYSLLVNKVNAAEQCLTQN